MISRYRLVCGGEGPQMPVVVKTSDGFYACKITGLVDATDEYWYKKFILDEYDKEFFKGARKDDLMSFAERMRIRTYVIGKTSKTKDLTIDQLHDEIKKKWDGFFQKDWAWEGEEDPTS